MTPSEFETAVDAGIEKNPEAFNGDFVRRAPKLSEERLAEIEQQTGIVLTSEYKHFLMRYGAGDFQFADVSSPDPESEWSLWTEYEYIPDGEKRMLPFANNGCGDYYCFKIQDGRCSKEIWWSDHEQEYELSPSEYSDFYEFITSVALKP
jgi:hypothetical protein